MNDEVAKGGEAQRLLDSRIFIEASKSVREGLMAQMAKVPMKDAEMHTKLILSLQLWDALEKHLKGIATTGKIVQFQVEQEAKQSKIREMLRFR